MLWLVLRLDGLASDYACTIYQAALLQKTDIIQGVLESGPAAPHCRNTHCMSVQIQLVLFY